MRLYCNFRDARLKKSEFLQSYKKNWSLYKRYGSSFQRPDSFKESIHLTTNILSSISGHVSKIHQNLYLDFWRLRGLPQLKTTRNSFFDTKTLSFLLTKLTSVITTVTFTLFVLFLLEMLWWTMFGQHGVYRQDAPFGNWNNCWKKVTWKFKKCFRVEKRVPGHVFSRSSAAEGYATFRNPNSDILQNGTFCPDC